MLCGYGRMFFGPNSLRFAVVVRQVSVTCGLVPAVNLSLMMNASFRC